MKFFVLTALVLAFCSVVSAEVGTIQSISFAADQGSLLVVIKGKGQLDCLKSYADNPPSITLDFPDVKNKAPKKLDAKDNTFITKITTEKYSNNNKDYTRVVVEMKAPWNY